MKLTTSTPRTIYLTGQSRTGDGFNSTRPAQVSPDGTVKVWDYRVSEFTSRHILTPAQIRKIIKNKGAQSITL